MITKNNKFKCDICGHFISFEDLDNGHAIHSMIFSDSHCSYETWQTVCKECNNE